MGVTDGQDINAATFNAAFLSKNANDTTTGTLGLNHTGSGSAVTDTQQVINNILASVSPTYIYNFGLAAATTTNANDSIKITGAAAALSATNIGRVTLPNSATAGLLINLSATADVTILLTGAHWGLDTLGDFSAIELRVYAINDNGTLKWGVSNKGGLRTIADTATSTTPANISTQSKVLVNSAISGGTWPCREIGWFLASFDDAGGAAANLWAVATTAGSINVGIPVKDETDTVSYTPTLTGDPGSSQNVGYWSRHGDKIQLSCYATFTTGSGSTVLTWSLPVGCLIDASKTASVATTYIAGASSWYDKGTAYKSAICLIDSNSTLKVADPTAGILTSGDVANGDLISFTVVLPIVGWSSN